MAHKPILVVIAQGVEGSTNLQITLKLLVVAQGGNSLLKKRGKRIIISYLMIFWFPSHIMQNFFELERPRLFLSKSRKFSKSYGKSLHTQTPVLGQNTHLNLVTSDNGPLAPYLCLCG